MIDSFFLFLFFKLFWLSSLRFEDINLVLLRFQHYISIKLRFVRSLGCCNSLIFSPQLFLCRFAAMLEIFFFLWHFSAWSDFFMNMKGFLFEGKLNIQKMFNSKIQDSKNPATIWIKPYEQTRSVYHDWIFEHLLSPWSVTSHTQDPAPIWRATSCWLTMASIGFSC